MKQLEKAAILITESDLTFSEITYKVGFASPSYFNKAFSKYYGINPYIVKRFYADKHRSKKDGVYFIQGDKKKLIYYTYEQYT